MLHAKWRNNNINSRKIYHKVLVLFYYFYFIVLSTWYLHFQGEFRTLEFHCQP